MIQNQIDLLLAQKTQEQKEVSQRYDAAIQAVREDYLARNGILEMLQSLSWEIGHASSPAYACLIADISRKQKILLCQGGIFVALPDWNLSANYQDERSIYLYPKRPSEIKTVDDLIALIWKSGFQKLSLRPDSQKRLLDLQKLEALCLTPAKEPQ